MKKTIFAVLAFCWVSGILLSCDGGNGGNSNSSGTNDGPIYPPVVFTADKDTNGKIELYAAFDDGNDIIKLSGPMVSGGNVVEFKISPVKFRHV